MWMIGDVIIISVIVFMFSIVIGIVIGRSRENYLWEVESVQIGHAQYNSKTGAWEWKEITVNRII